MYKFVTVLSIIGLAVILAGCSTSNTSSDSKEIRIIHEYHFYQHNVGPMNRPILRKNVRFGQSKGIDPRYDHKPGQGRPQKLNNPKSGIDPRYDHKPGMMPPKKNTTKE